MNKGYGAKAYMEQISYNNEGNDNNVAKELNVRNENVISRTNCGTENEERTRRKSEGETFCKNWKKIVRQTVAAHRKSFWKEWDLILMETL